MTYLFTDIFDIPKLTELCERYTESHGIVTALLDLDGNIHVQTGWQDICTKFHRVNPTSASRCLESDTELASQLAKGNKYNVYHCKNGLVDVAVPIYVNGKHEANLFTGQFFFQQPEQNRFVKQAKDLGYELIPYLDALEKVPVFSEEKVRKFMGFLVSLAQIIGEMGKAKLDILELQKKEREQLALLQMRNDELKENQILLKKMAIEDELTQLNNRREFNTRLNYEFSRAMRYKHSLTVAMIDIDKFKLVNDLYGHAMGDHILQSVAKMLASSVRETDIVSRIGGDEFCLIFPETDLEEAQDVLITVAKQINATEFQAKKIKFNVSCSFGIASLQDDSDSIEELVHRADQALYRAKSTGRNKVVVHTLSEA